MRKKPKKDCLFCGEKTKRTTTQFCSRDCMNAYRSKHKIRQGGPKRQKEWKYCIWCDRLFYPTHNYIKSCSKRCSGKYRFHIDKDTVFLEKAHESARNMSQEQRAKLAIAMVRRNKDGKLHTLGRGGIRKDIGHYVRSRWEANIARLLNTLGVKYEYEDTHFHLKTDTNSYIYTPDFHIAENVFIEVKGWETPKAKIKRELMPEQFCNVHIISQLVMPIIFKLDYTDTKEAVLWI